MWQTLIFLGVWLLAYLASEVAAFLTEVCRGQEE